MLCSTAFRFSNLIIDFSVPAFGRAGADLTRPIDSPYFFLMAGTQYRAGRPSERRNTTESETVTGSNAQRPSLLYPGNGHTYFLLSIMAAARFLSSFFLACPSESRTRSLFLHCGGRGILAILSRVRVTHSPCVQGYKRVQYQRNCAASAGVQERTINTR